MRPAVTFHETRESVRKGVLHEIERWRMSGGRLYEKSRRGTEPPVVRVVAGERGVEMSDNRVRKLRPAEIARWLRDVRMVPENFLAHAEEMGVVASREGGIERLEAASERLALERDAKSGVPKRVLDLRSKRAIVFEQPLDVQGRHWPRRETHTEAGRETARDRIVSVEFDAPPPPEVTRLWEALERGGGV